MWTRAVRLPSQRLQWSSRISNFGAPKGTSLSKSLQHSRGAQGQEVFGTTCVVMLAVPSAMARPLGAVTLATGTSAQGATPRNAGACAKQPCLIAVCVVWTNIEQSIFVFCLCAVWRAWKDTSPVGGGEQLGGFALQTEMFRDISKLTTKPLKLWAFQTLIYNIFLSWAGLLFLPGAGLAYYSSLGLVWLIIPPWGWSGLLFLPGAGPAYYSSLELVWLIIPPWSWSGLLFLPGLVWLIIPLWGWVGLLFLPGAGLAYYSSLGLVWLIIPPWGWSGLLFLPGVGLAYYSSLELGWLIIPSLGLVWFIIPPWGWAGLLFLPGAGWLIIPP